MYLSLEGLLDASEVSDTSYLVDVSRKNFSAIDDMFHAISEQLRAIDSPLVEEWELARAERKIGNKLMS